MTVLLSLLEMLPQGARVLDYGCFGWKLVSLSIRNDLQHHGCDISLPEGKPDAAEFHVLNEQKIEAPDDHFDLVVASHVLEHVSDPMLVFRELARVCKPSGRIYIETPSDRSAMQTSDPDASSHSFYSFWDDPTHIRPWTPASLYRLAICHGYVPERAEYMTSLKAKLLFPFKWWFYGLLGNGHKRTEALWEAKDWVCFALIRKPADATGMPHFKYLSLKDVPAGANAALRLYKGK